MENKELLPMETSGKWVERPNYNSHLREFESGLIRFLQQQGLPSNYILVPVDERITVFFNLEGVLSRIDEDQRGQSVYLSKFVAAVASGLFDAALNYLWDETIYQLRKRVAQYDISYFFDNAVNAEKRKKLKDEEDLVKLDDAELIHGAREIGLISELGYKHLDFIKYMRNWASAAHPNQNELTGLQLISWLETCIREVISLPLTNAAIEIKKLLKNIKENSISESEARQIAVFFSNLTQEQVNNLAHGFFGIYVRQDTTAKARENIHLLLPYLWERVSEETRQQFGIKYGKFVANNEQAEQQLARRFLQIVSAENYIPDGLRAAEIKEAIENLLNAHRGYNNFYTEPPFARELKRLVGQYGNVPAEINKEYVLALVEVYLTNGNGVAWNAEPIYSSLIDEFDSDQALMAILSFSHPVIASKLQFNLCAKYFVKLIERMKAKVSAPAVKELIEEIQTYEGPLDRMKDDTRFKRKVDVLKKIIG